MTLTETNTNATKSNNNHTTKESAMLKSLTSGVKTAIGLLYGSREEHMEKSAAHRFGCGVDSRIFASFDALANFSGGLPIRTESAM